LALGEKNVKRLFIRHWNIQQQCLLDGETRVHINFSSGGDNVDILLFRFRLLTTQWKWTFTKRFPISTPQRKWPMSRQQSQNALRWLQCFFFTHASFPLLAVTISLH